MYLSTLPRAVDLRHREARGAAAAVDPAAAPLRERGRRHQRRDPADLERPVGGRSGSSTSSTCATRADPTADRAGSHDRRRSLPLGPLYGTGHTASCIQNCRYAYLAGTDQRHRHRRPDRPGEPEAGRQLPGRGGRPGWPATTCRSTPRDWPGSPASTAPPPTTRPNPLAPEARLPHRRDRPRASTAIEPTDGKTLNDFIHHNSMRMNNGVAAPSPPPGADPTAESDTVLVTEEDYTRPTCEGAGQFETWRIGGGRACCATSTRS